MIWDVFYSYFKKRDWCAGDVTDVDSVLSPHAVHPPRLRPALSAPEHPPLGSAGGVRRHCGPTGHVCVVETAAGLWGGIYSGVLPAGSTRGRGAPRLHAVWRWAGRQAGGRQLQGAALSTVLLLLMHTVSANITERTLFHLKHVCRLPQGKLPTLYVMYFTNLAALLYGDRFF